MKVQDFLSNPLNKYSAAFLEGRVNALGYSRMTENKMEEARRLFELNTNLFPQSGNTFDSYAEFCLRGGQRMEALEYYQKALQAEPNYGNADEARKIIKQLKDGEK
jgi:tetratricopeptide (TPR) repeat protein